MLPINTTIRPLVMSSVYPGYADDNGQVIMLTGDLRKDKVLFLLSNFCYNIMLTLCRYSSNLNKNRVLISYHSDSSNSIYEIAEIGERGVLLKVVDVRDADNFVWVLPGGDWTTNTDFLVCYSKIPRESHG